MSQRDCNFHLGDNANVTLDGATYIGMAVDFPVVLSNGNAAPKLIVHTNAVETYAEWQAHTVYLDNHLLGYIRDADGLASERHEFPVPSGMIDGAMRRLVIRVVGKGPGLEDDFVLKRIESEGVDLRFGWV